jgi:polyhydroxybutyrate depolymerase
MHVCGATLLATATLACSGSTPGNSGVGGAGDGTGVGGTTGAGGATATGGATAAGGRGGTTADGGANTDGGASASNGCGATSWPTASPQTINVTDRAGNTVARQFYFALPSAYDPAHPYPLVFAFHYLGGQASTIAGTGFSGRYYGIQPLLPNAIYVAPQGLAANAADGGAGQTGFPNTNDQDIAFTRAMVSWFQGNLCVDKARIMSTGFSYGGMMSHTIACEMPDVFRAVGIMSGILIGRATSCINHGIAAWVTHGEQDTTLAYATGVTAKDRIVTLNHCGSTTHPVDPAPCVQYDGCDADYPVIWCSVAGEGHAIPSFGASAIARFFAQF